MPSATSHHHHHHHHHYHHVIEVFLSNGENNLITFEAPRVRDDVCQRLLAR
jgi:hypothetical protein